MKSGLNDVVCRGSLIEGAGGGISPKFVMDAQHHFDSQHAPDRNCSSRANDSIADTLDFVDELGAIHFGAVLVLL